VNKVDPFGLWGAKVHSILTSSVLGLAKFNDEDIKIATTANLNVDRIANQGNDAAHYMPGSEANAQTIVDTCLERAINCEIAGDRKGAMEALGEGLHTLQDKSAHSDQKAGWKAHIDGTAPDDPFKQKEHFKNAFSSSKNYVKSFSEQVEQRKKEQAKKSRSDK
jgi:hypothetical protein